MDIAFEENLSKCMENLKIENYRAATSDLYPISKQTTRLGNASDGVVSQFANQMISVLEMLKEKIGDENRPTDTDNARFVLMDVYRILRTSCTANTKVQDEFGGHRGQKVMECTRVILDSACRHYNGEALIQSLAVGIQFLSNLASGCPKNQDLVWDHFHAYLYNWLNVNKGESETMQEKGIKILNYACAVIDSCFPRQFERDPNFIRNPENQALMIAVVQANTIWKLEFGKKAMLKVVQVPNLLNAVYGELSHSERLCVMYALQEVITEWRNCDEKGSPVPTIGTNLGFYVRFLIESTRMTVDTLHIREASLNTDVHMHVRMVELLAAATCCADYANEISMLTVPKAEEPKTLLMYALCLLKDIHKKGQEGHNMLSMVRNAIEVDDSHPAFLLRRDLLRIIGNLAYKNRRNQDLVREAYGKVGIPLLFDHTVIDVRNPFATEWAKLALTNLVRDNEDNAKFVKSMKLQGHVDPTGILQDCGLTLETKGNKVVVKTEGQVLSASKLSEKAPFRP